ncbi:hypothetical protein K458DRAFT_432609 [Lentithecium fluviatile CBS 122367]|uniref:Uncharacterized protein n=1 Tax=Lentithecium fluviatile CBS 122367 TaxID=1168545 RepID=A0A6G1IWL0_9PLEO|nr:hypothetical protein K458DRAFT_432609 [Lentithecium fluviatile CBS 122367]
MPAGTSGSKPDWPGPANLLWQDQFMRQHAHLLQRMNKLEERNALYDGRTRKAEQAAATYDTTAAEIKDLKARLKAFEDDPEDQKRDELVGKMLAEHTRELAILKDKVKSVDSLASDVRNYEEDRDEVLQTVGACKKVIRDLETKVRILESLPSDDTAAAIRDATARLKHLETRDGTRSQQLQNMQDKLNALETDCQDKAAEINRLRDELAKERDDGNVKGGRQARSEIQVPRSPEMKQSSDTLLASSPPHTIRKKPAKPHLIPSTQHDTQIQPLFPETQSWSQATTQSEAPDDKDEFTQPRSIQGGSSQRKKQRPTIHTAVTRAQKDAHALAATRPEASETYGEPTQPRDARYKASNPRKKQKLDVRTSLAQKQRNASGQDSKKVSSKRLPMPPAAQAPEYLSKRAQKNAQAQASRGGPSKPGRKITLRYGPRPGFGARTAAHGHAPNVPPQTRVPPIQPRVQLPTQGRSGSPEATQSQTANALRRSLRNLGTQAPTDTQYLELAPNGLCRPQPVLGKRDRNEPSSPVRPTSPVKAVRQQKSSALNSRSAAPQPQTRPRRKPPVIEDAEDDLGWI